MALIIAEFVAHRTTNCLTLKTKVMKKLFPVPAWMFGMNISTANIKILESGEIEAKYIRTIGYMAKDVIEYKTFKNYDEYLIYVDNYLTALYCNAYLTNEDRIILNKLDVTTSSSLAYLSAKDKFKNGTAIEYLHRKITLKTQYKRTKN
jgi:hypothetical protein